MSKITIFLCAAFFAAAVDAFSLTQVLQTAQQLVETLQTAKSTKIELLSEVIEIKSSDLRVKLETAADNFIDEFARDVGKTTDEVKGAVWKTIDEAKQYVHVQKCTNMIDKIDEIANDAVSNLTRCVVEHKDEGTALIEKFETSTLGIIANITSRPDRRAENDVGVISLFKTVASIKLGAIKKTLSFATNTPTLVVNASKMMYFFTTLESSLKNCLSAYGLDTLKKNLKAVVHDIHTCIEMKRSNHRLYMG